ncbi:MAG: insulinase family protein [Saprospiraceae bacterium]|nr:insulinase family protein [Saprospiraceae bacterium]
MRYLFLLMVCAFVLQTSAAQETMPERVTSVEGISEYHLENGLKVLLFPDPSKQTITVNITYLVGSRHEQYGETGMAHLLEHLVFKGTPNHPDIPKELSDHGCRPNGTTWFDRTNYFETFAASDENLRWALDLEADRMVNSFISKEDLDSEMTVVRNEFEAGENYPQAVLQERIMSTAYLWHNYGNTTIGARSDIENVPIDRLQAFYKRYYQPDNAVLMVAGKIEEEKTLEMVMEYFAPIPKPERKLIPTYTEEPVQDGERFVSLERKGDIQSAACLYHICSGLHPDDAAIDVLIRAVTSRPSGRLYQRLIETKKATQEYGYSMSLREPGFAYFVINVLKEESLPEAQKIFLDVLDSLSIDPLSEEEVERAKAEILKEIELGLTNTANIGMFMSEYIAMGDWRMLYIGRDRIEQVTADDVLRVAKHYFQPSNRTVGQFIPAEEEPQRVEIPDAPSVATLVDGYVGKEVMDQGEAFDPAPANIESRTLKGKFANGMRYAFLPKDTKGDVVYANIAFRSGSEEALHGQGALPSITPAMLDKGTTSKSRQEISDLLDEWQAELSVSGAPGKTFINIKTTKDQLEKTLDLAGEILREPAFPENELEAMIQARVAGIEQSRSEPNYQAFNTIQRHVYPYPAGHPSYTMTADESIADLNEINTEAVKKYYDSFIGPGDGATVTILGEFDPDEIKGIVERNFVQWDKEDLSYDRIPSKAFTVEPMRKDLKTPDKTNAFFIGLLSFPMSENDADYPALHVANYLLGGGFLNSRLAVRIRQEEGLSYGVGSQLGADAQDDETSFLVYAISNPDNSAAVQESFFKVLEEVRSEGFTEEELAAAKQGLLQGSVVDRSEDQGLLTTLNNNQTYDRDMLWYEKFDAAIEALTVEEVNKAFNKYVQPDKISIIKAGDFKEKVIKP